MSALDFLATVELSPESEAIRKRFLEIFREIDAFLEISPDESLDEDLKEELDSLKKLYPLTVAKCATFLENIKAKQEKLNSSALGFIIVDLDGTVRAGQKFLVKQKSKEKILEETSNTKSDFVPGVRTPGDPFVSGRGLPHDD